MCADHSDRRDREDHRNEAWLRRKAEGMHTEAKIMHLDPDRPRDLALGAAGVKVAQGVQTLTRFHALGPWDMYALVLSMATPRTSLPSYEQALYMAELWTVLAAAIDRAEHADPASGDAA